jgi:hypothetical protein
VPASAERVEVIDRGGDPANQLYSPVEIVEIEVDIRFGGRGPPHQHHEEVGSIPPVERQAGPPPAASSSMYRLIRSRSHALAILGRQRGGHDQGEVEAQVAVRDDLPVAEPQLPQQAPEMNIVLSVNGPDP